MQFPIVSGRTPFAPTLIFSSMKFYSALVKENSDGSFEDLIVLQEGFSYSAFFFSILWFLYYKMWYEAALVLLTNLTINVLPLPSFDKIILHIAMYLIIAANANSWLAEHLQKRKNYQLLGFVHGSDPLDAKLHALETSKFA